MYFALYTFFIYPAYTAKIPNTHANKKHYNNPFSWSDEGRPVPKPKNPWSHGPRLIYLPLRLEEVKFHIGKWKRGKISMIIMHHHIYGFPQKKIQDQQNSGAHFAMSSSAEKNIFSRNPRENHWISRSPLHKTRRWVPLRHRSEY